MPLDPLTIISAIVAVIVLWKLKSVLGQRTGLEKPPTNPFVDARPSSPPGSKLPPPHPGARAARASPNPARWASFAEPGSPLAAGLDGIASADPSFEPVSFLEGAKIAYEAVITAFAAAERGSLRNLLAAGVYDSFAAAIDVRQQRGETMTTTFVSLDDAEFLTAAVDGKTAQIGVRFTSKQISATHGADGKLTDGDPDRVVDMDDIWTFARDVNSRDPNWKLVATQSGH